MKKLIKLVPAFIMLLVSAILVSTATFAWFSMNTTVTATGMQVKATAEKGIVISNMLQSTWSNTANAHSLNATLYPTSHSESEGSAASSWVHNTSNDAEHAMPNQDDYDALAIVNSANTEGIGYVEMGNNAQYDANSDPAYYLLNQFYIKSSDAEISNTHLYINDVSATSTTLAVDVSLRVLVDIYEHNGTSYVLKSSNIYAPVATSSKYPTTQYNWKGLATGAVAVTAKYGADRSTTYFNTDTTVVTIPAYNASNPLLAQVYVYFEGEDGNCRTKNINGITTDDITVSVKFGTTKLGTDFTQVNYVALVQIMDNITSTVESGSIVKNGVFTATYTAETGYSRPTTITVKVGGTPLVSGTDYTYDSTTGKLDIGQDKITGALEITVEATRNQ